jgi:hypothetical protein
VMSPLAAISGAKAILIGVASGAVVVLIALAVLSGSRRKPKAPELDIPRAMQPGPSDIDLEKPILEKLIAWGGVLTLFMAIWLPVVWLLEPEQNKTDTEVQLAQSVERGRLTTLLGNEENQIGFNCERCHGPGLHGGLNVFNGSIVQVPNLQTVCGGASTGHPLITSLNDVVNTIAQGRSGTDMPSWSVRFAGAMDDQQINDLVNYILSIQKVPRAQNICLEAPVAAATPSASATP